MRDKHNDVVLTPLQLAKTVYITVVPSTMILCPLFLLVDTQFWSRIFVELYSGEGNRPPHVSHVTAYQISIQVVLVYLSRLTNLDKATTNFNKNSTNYPKWTRNVQLLIRHVSYPTTQKTLFQVDLLSFTISSPYEHILWINLALRRFVMKQRFLQ